MSTDADVTQAEAEAERAKRRLFDTVSTLKSRLTPGALARNAGEKIKDTGQGIVRSGAEAVKRHPLPVIGAVALLGAFFARKPLLRRLGRKNSDN